MAGHRLSLNFMKEMSKFNLFGRYSEEDWSKFVWKCVLSGHWTVNKLKYRDWNIINLQWKIDRKTVICVHQKTDNYYLNFEAKYRQHGWTLVNLVSGGQNTATSNVCGRNYLKCKIARLDLVLESKNWPFQLEMKDRWHGSAHAVLYGNLICSIWAYWCISLNLQTKLCWKKVPKRNNAFGRMQSERKRWTYELTENGGNHFEQMWSEKYGSEITSTTN